MRLLLDEHLSPAIAMALRQEGHDVIAVAERPDLRGQGDTRILVAAATERRSLVTADVVDFTVLGAQRLPDRNPHHGIVLLSHGSFPRSTAAVGSIVRALARLLRDFPGEDDLVGDKVWLTRAPHDPA